MLIGLLAGPAIEVDAANQSDACTSEEENEQLRETTKKSSSGWNYGFVEREVQNGSVQQVAVASKEILVPMEALPIQTEGPISEVEVTPRNCSAAICTIIVHIYSSTTTSVETHVGTFGFLPGYYGKVSVTQEVEVEEESEIHCNGETFITLKFTGGPGPRAATASIWKTQATQEYQECAYLNIPYDESCTITFTGPIEIDARTPGRFTRFDIVQGGRYSNDDNLIGALGAIDVPDVEFKTSDGRKDLTLDGDVLPFDKAGEWKAVLSAINIDFEVTEEEVEQARAALLQMTS